MIFPINVSSNVQEESKHDVQRSITANLNHVRNNYNHDRNPVKGTHNQLAKQYDSYNTLANAKAILNHEFADKIKQHDISKSVKKNPNRRYGSVKNYVSKQKGNPYRFYVITLGTMQDKQKLLKLGARYGKDKPMVYHAINQALLNYGKNFNHTHQNLKFITDDTNLFEHGAFHAHLLMLATGKTRSGKPSLSYNTAMRIEYSNDKDYRHPMKDNRNAFKIMHQREDEAVTRQLTQSFQRYISPEISFKLQRTHSKHTGIAHDKYVEIQKMNDKLRQLISSANKQNTKLKAEVNRLISNKDNLKYTKSYNYLVDTANKVISSLANNNQRLRNHISTLRYQNRKLNQLNIDDTDILRGLPSALDDLNHRLTIASEWQTTYHGEVQNISHLQKQINQDRKNLNTMIANNNNWNQSLPKLKSRLKQFQDISQLSPQLLATLGKLSHEPKESLVKYLTGLIENEKPDGTK